MKMKSLIIFIIILIIGLFSGSCKKKYYKTDRSKIMKFNNLKKYCFINNFKLGGQYNLADEKSYEFGGENGTTLESLGYGPLRTAYITVGIPKKNKDGKIINAVVITSSFLSDSTESYQNFANHKRENNKPSSGAIGHGELIDTEKTYVIFLDDIGLWGASKPGDGLGNKFPEYSLYDMVQTNYILLKNHLNIDKIQLIIGESIMANLSYVWAILHPDFIDTLISIGPALSTPNPGQWLFQLAYMALLTDPIWDKTNGDYYHLPYNDQPWQGMAFSKSFFNYGNLNKINKKHKWEDLEPDLFSWIPVRNQTENLKKEALRMDTNDWRYRFKTYNPNKKSNITKELNKIKARVLSIYIENNDFVTLDTLKNDLYKINNVRLLISEKTNFPIQTNNVLYVFKDSLLPIFKELDITK